MLVTPSCQVLDLKKFSFDVTLIFSRVHKKTMFQKTKYWVRLMGSKEVEHPGERCTLYCLLREQGPLTISNVWFTVFPHIVAAATILFWIHLVRKLFKFSFPLCNENLNSFLTRWGNYSRRGNYSREETIWGNTVFEIFYNFQKRIVSAETTCGNTVFMFLPLMTWTTTEWFRALDGAQVYFPASSGLTVSMYRLDTKTASSSCRFFLEILKSASFVLVTIRTPDPWSE